MGKPMARNLLRAGYRLTVRSRSPGPVEELKAEGAEARESPRAVAERSDVVITMLPDSPDVEQVCLGAMGLIETPRADARERPFPLTVIDMSTISPRVSGTIGERLAAVGMDFLEAPVSGGDVGAIRGTLSIMAGGPPEVFERVKPIFQTLGKSSILIGGWGAGQTTKLANNIICATTIEAVAEAFVLGAKAELDPEKMFQALRGGAAACWSLENKVPKIVARDFEPGFMVQLHLKDLNLALEAARQLNVDLPVTRQVRDMLAELVEEGRGRDDNGALVRVLERRAGVEVRRRGSPAADGTSD